VQPLLPSFIKNFKLQFVKNGRERLIDSNLFIGGDEILSSLWILVEIFLKQLITELYKEKLC